MDFYEILIVSNLYMDVIYADRELVAVHVLCVCCGHIDSHVSSVMLVSRLLHTRLPG